MVFSIALCAHVYMLLMALSVVDVGIARPLCALGLTLIEREALSMSRAGVCLLRSSPL